jgi:hypothetical protein
MALEFGRQVFESILTAVETHGIADSAEIVLVHDSPRRSKGYRQD